MKRSLSVIGLVFSSLFCNQQGLAEPYLAVKTGQKCSACHVNPIGGGARNDFGSYYGAQQLAETVIAVADGDPGKINETLRFGGDLRFNFDRNDTEQTTQQGFATQNAQLYLSLTPKNSKIQFYLDQQVAPGSVFAREAYGLLKLKNSHYLRAGKIMLPYGLRLEDDSAFIRQATGINFDNSDNGIDLGLEWEHWVVNIALSNGSTGTTNDDENLQYAARGEYVERFWRVGASALINDAEAGQRQMYNIFMGAQLGKVGLLAEADYIEDESVSNIFGNNLIQLASLLEFNYGFSQGYNLKLSLEWLDPDDGIADNARARYSALFEYTPYSFLQLRAGVREGDDIPQRDAGNFTNIFIQTHMYF